MGTQQQYVEGINEQMHYDSLRVIIASMGNTGYKVQGKYDGGFGFIFNNELVGKIFFYLVIES